MEDLKRRNITIDAIEEDGNEKKPVIKATNFDPKNYLNVRLDIEHGELSKEIRIRLLTIDNESDSPFKRIKMHNMKVPKEISKSGYKSYICLEKVDDIDHEKYGKKCPFCELNREAYKKSIEPGISDVDKKRWQEISLKNLAGDVGIIRCIERGKEEEGPKFWKFNIRQDKKDPLNVIKKLFATRLQESREDGEELNILDIDEGKDLKLTITAVMDKNTGKPTNKTTIDIVDYGKVKPLTDDEELRDKWLNDTKKWSDVFVPKTYDYLSILIDGGIPWFDRETKKWISKEDFDNRTSIEKEELEEVKIEADEEIEKAMVEASRITTNNSDEEELPF